MVPLKLSHLKREEVKNWRHRKSWILQRSPVAKCKAWIRKDLQDTLESGEIRDYDCKPFVDTDTWGTESSCVGTVAMGTNRRLLREPFAGLVASLEELRTNKTCHSYAILYLRKAAKDSVVRCKDFLAERESSCGIELRGNWHSFTILYTEIQNI